MVFMVNECDKMYFMDVRMKINNHKICKLGAIIKIHMSNYISFNNPNLNWDCHNDIHRQTIRYIYLCIDNANSQPYSN